MKALIPQLYDLFTDHSAFHRSDLVKKLNAKRTTLFDSLEEMEEKQILKRVTRKMTAGRGRPNTFWIKNPSFEGTLASAFASE